MTSFLGVEGVTAWLRSEGIESVTADVMRYVEEDFLRWSALEKVPRLASHSASGVIELMPTSDGVAYAFKYVNGHPGNPTLGLQTVTAFGVLADVHTGYPLFVAEMTILTALRTAATSAIAARALAPAGCSSMAIIGCGSQAEFQALALRQVLGVNELRIWDTHPAASSKLERHAQDLGFEVTIAGSPEDAAAGAHVITTCTAEKAHAVVVADTAIRDGVHINAVGGDCPGKTELSPATLKRAKVFVEYEPQTRIEGEIQQMPPDFPVTELWRVLTGEAEGRGGDTDVTIFDSVGFAAEDLAVLRCARDATTGGPFVRELDLVAEPTSPGDLFGMVADPRQPA